MGDVALAVDAESAIAEDEQHRARGKGGEVLDHFDSRGKLLGSTVNTFHGDSVIRITSDQQIQLGRDLLAGKTIDVRGGVSPYPAPTVADPWADQGIVVDFEFDDAVQLQSPLGQQSV